MEGIRVMENIAQIRTAVITKDTNLKDVLFSLFNIDEDHNGNNEGEYLCEDAKEKGCKSNLEYWIEDALLHLRHIHNIVDYITQQFLAYDGYYLDMNFEIQEHQDIIFVAISWIEGDL